MCLDHPNYVRHNKCARGTRRVETRSSQLGKLLSLFVKQVICILTLQRYCPSNNLQPNIAKSHWDCGSSTVFIQTNNHFGEISQRIYISYYCIIIKHARRLHAPECVSLFAKYLNTQPSLRGCPLIIYSRPSINAKECFFHYFTINWYEFYQVINLFRCAWYKVLY